MLFTKKIVLGYRLQVTSEREKKHIKKLEKKSILIFFEKSSEKALHHLPSKEFFFTKLSAN
jgi:hypothetical protein